MDEEMGSRTLANPLPKPVYSGNLTKIRLTRAFRRGYKFDLVIFATSINP